MSHFQTMQPVSRVYVLPRCDVEVYEVSNTPGVLGVLAWTAKQVDNLRIGEKFNEIARFSTGIPYSTTHHTDEVHEIAFDAVWNVSARLERNHEYIVGITWQDASLGSTSRSWVRRFYQRVTTSSRDLNSRESNEFGSSNVLSAKYYVETVGENVPADTAPGQETC